MKTMFLLLFLSSPLFLSAQTKADSLVNVLNTTNPTISEQLALYYEIYKAYVFLDLEKASEYSKKGLTMAEKENNKAMVSKFNAAFGKIYNMQSSYDTALIYWERVLDQAIKLKDRDQEATAYLGMGNTYALSNEGVSALEYFMKALSIFEGLGDQPTCIMVMVNIASLYRGIDNDERVIYYLEKAKKLAEEIDDATGKMQVYFELGAIYHRLADIDGDRRKVDQALEYELKAHEISLSLGNRQYQMATTHALATIYYDYLEDYDRALKYAKVSLQIAEEIGDRLSVAWVWSSISGVYRAQKRYQESEDAALKALEIDSTNVFLGISLMENIILSNIMLGNKDKARMFFNKYMDLNNKRVDQSNREMMADMEVKYETKKKEIHIAALEEEQKLYISLGATAVAALLLGIGLLVYRHRLTEQKKKQAEQQILQLEQEKELIIARASLDAEKAEREIIARDLHDGVGTMLSVVKNNMDIIKSYSIIENKELDYFNKALEGLDKSIVELRRVAHHIMPAILVEKGLYTALDDFCHSIPEAEFHRTEHEFRFDPEKELVLYRCAYELVNNALRHAKATRIDVHVNVDEKTVYLSVVDNGCGFDPQTTSVGMGINNMRTRLSAFGGHIDFYSEQGKGTEVNVELDI